MIVAFSTSSPLASVAILAPDGRVLAFRSRRAPQAASSACVALLDECLEVCGRSLADATLFAADIGPGSFTGTRVGVVMAKTMAFDRGRPCAGAASFDLIEPGGAAYVPSKKGEWLLRLPNRPPVRAAAENLRNAKGYGLEGAEHVYPTADRFGELLPLLTPLRPHELMPFYFHEPSISQPKKPFRSLGGGE